MKEYHFNDFNCTVRIHGGYDPENVKQATTAYLKKAEAIRKRNLKAAQALPAEEKKGA